jgi:hypothetical protein
MKKKRNKIWDQIFQPLTVQADAQAKRVDKRFFGWIEYEYYVSSHFSYWYLEFPFRNYWEQEFLDDYFSNRQEYIDKVSAKGTPVFRLDFRTYKIKEKKV